MDKASRPTERRGFLRGAILTALGVLLALFGFGRITHVETLQGSLAIEKEINYAFAHGGVRAVTPTVAPAPSELAPPPWPENDPATPGMAKAGTPRFRIDTTSVDPCPT